MGIAADVPNGKAVVVLNTTAATPSPRNAIPNGSTLEKHSRTVESGTWQGSCCWNNIWWIRE